MSCSKTRKYQDGGPLEFYDFKGLTVFATSVPLLTNSAVSPFCLQIYAAARNNPLFDAEAAGPSAKHRSEISGNLRSFCVPATNGKSLVESNPVSGMPTPE